MPLRPVRPPLPSRSWTRLPLLLLLLAVLLPAPTAAADPQREVERAVRTVAELRVETRRAAERLTEQTRRWERARTELTEARRSAATARAHAVEAQAAEAEARRRLSVLVAAAYRAPVPDDVVLALTTGPDGLGDALAARADLQRLQGREDELLQRAEAARTQAAELAARADDLEARSREAAVEVEERLRGLRAQARRAEQRLGAAGRQLRRAREEASCTDSAGSHPNGFLPRAALCSIGGGHLLRADAARAFRAMNAERPLCVTDAYRSYAGQVAVYRATPSLAAVPGTSKHGLGIALDLGCGAQRFDSETYAWLKANAPRFGWVHPDWAEPGGSMPEPWHWEFVG